MKGNALLRQTVVSMIISTSFPQNMIQECFGKESSAENIKDIIDYIFKSRLTEPQRKVIELRFQDGHTYREIAHRIGLSASRVTQLKDRVFKILTQNADLIFKGNINPEEYFVEENYENIPISRLELSLKTYDALWSSGYKNVKDVVDGVEKGKIRSVWNIGNNSYTEILIKLNEKCGFSKKQPSAVILLPSAQPNIEQEPVTKLSMSTRTKNAFVRCKIRTIGDIIECIRDKSIFNLRNFGEKSFCDLTEQLKSFGVIVNVSANGSFINKYA